MKPILVGVLSAAITTTALADSGGSWREEVPYCPVILEGIGEEEKGTSSIQQGGNVVLVFPDKVDQESKEESDLATSLLTSPLIIVAVIILLL